MNTEKITAENNVLVATGLKVKTTIKARTKAICSLIAILFTLALAIPAQAQVDPGTHDVFQTDVFGNRIKVGEIYVPVGS